MRILGVDPGTTRIGYGLVESNGTLKLLDFGVIEIAAQNDAERIHELARKFAALIGELHPDSAGVEKLYFARNRKTALSVSQARGALLLLLKEKGVFINELHPGEVKLAVAGHGSADKRAVSEMVKKILGVSELDGYDDASDAIAIAIATADKQKFGRRVGGSFSGENTAV